MIELTSEQQQSIQDGKAILVRENGREYVMLRPDVYARLAEESFDAGSWTAEELDQLREESVALLDQYGKDKKKCIAIDQKPPREITSLKCRKHASGSIQNSHPAPELGNGEKTNAETARHQRKVASKTINPARFVRWQR